MVHKFLILSQTFTVLILKKAKMFSSLKFSSNETNSYPQKTKQA